MFLSIEKKNIKFAIDLRKDIQMKSILRRIHRDIKHDFYFHTNFDFNKLYRKNGYLKN